MLPVLTLFYSCELDLVPYNDITAETLVATADGAKGMANGCLMMMKQQLTDDPRNMYVRHLFQLTEFPSDDVLIVKSTTDNLWLFLQPSTHSRPIEYLVFMVYWLQDRP